MRRTALVLLAWVASSCVTLTPEGTRVSVYTAPLDGLPVQREMPDGCRRLMTLPKDWMSELELAAKDNPFAKQQNATAAAGANVLLVLKQLGRPRRDVECPNALPILDCPGSSGAWYNVAFEGYACTPEAIRTLNTPKGTARAVAHQRGNLRR